MSETNFPKGIFASKPHEKAPDFIKAEVSIKVDDAIEWLKENKNDRGYVNLQILESKDKSKYYAALNDWKPEKKDGETAPEDIGF